jgi:hypothetical protein
VFTQLGVLLVLAKQVLGLVIVRAAGIPLARVGDSRHLTTNILVAITTTSDYPVNSGVTFKIMLPFHLPAVVVRSN